MTEFIPNGVSYVAIGSLGEGVALGKGAKDASELYLEVGTALTIWEASEDVLLSIFRFLCSEFEPTACETFLIAPRSSKNKMLISAAKRYSRYILENEVAELSSAIKKLDKLAVRRNEIAHGQVMSFDAVLNNKEVASGYFLLSSLQGDIAHERNIKYAYDIDKIKKFSADVREIRAKLSRINFAILPRVHHWNEGMSRDQQDSVRFAVRMAKGEMSRQNFVKWVKMSDFSSSDPNDRN